MFSKVLPQTKLFTAVWQLFIWSNAVPGRLCRPIGLKGGTVGGLWALKLLPHAYNRETFLKQSAIHCWYLFSDSQGLSYPSY